MGGKSRRDYLKAIYSRYKKVSKPLRARILDEFCQVCGYNRKYAIRLLNGPATGDAEGKIRRGTQHDTGWHYAPRWYGACGNSRGAPGRFRGAL